jgi:hypothetical protein
MRSDRAAMSMDFTKAYGTFNVPPRCGRIGHRWRVTMSVDGGGGRGSGTSMKMNRGSAKVEGSRADTLA